MKKKMSLPSLSVIATRLQLIFPEGISHRNYMVRDIAARTIFVMLYVGAIEGSMRWIRPDQVTKMTDVQAARTSENERLEWARLSVTPGKLKGLSGTWYAANTREPIRDETLRLGLIPTGAVVERSGLTTTSAQPRYALAKEFADLFDETISDKKLEERIRKWQKSYLSAGALARIQILKRGASFKADAVRIEFPNGETRLLSPGPSSIISRAVIEEFAPRYLQEPAVLWLSESSNKIVARDVSLAKAIGIHIEVDKNLPDIILVDTGAPETLIVFVEVVATDGPIDELRKQALSKIVAKGGFDTKHVAFLTAFRDRTAAAFKKASAELAWGSFVWFASEPAQVIVLRDGKPKSRKLFELL